MFAVPVKWLCLHVSFLGRSLASVDVTPTLRHIGGRNNPYVVDAVDERKLRYRTEVVQPPFAAKQKSWNLPLVNVIQDR